MKVINLTGDNSAAVGFKVETAADGSVIGKLTVGMMPAPGAIGDLVGANVPLTQALEIHFDKPESVAVFLNRMTNGYNSMAYRQLQEKVRQEGLAEAQRRDAAKKEALKGRIEQMARELSALQGEYAELETD